MLCLSSTADLAGWDRVAPAVVLVAAEDQALLLAGVRALDLETAPGVAALLAARPRGRPVAVQLDAAIALSVSLVGPEASLHQVRALCAERGLLVIVARPLAPDAVAAIAAAGSPPVALAVLLTEIGRLSEESLDAYAEELSAVYDDRPGLLSAQQRRHAMGLRRALLSVDGMFEAQHRLLADDESPLAQLPDRRVAAARHRFAYVSELAGRLYSAAGDDLSQQSALVTEQLTTVNTIFLPLTLGAALFGTNFGWLTDHIGSWEAFVVLGLGVPALLSLATVLLVGRRR